MNVYTLANKSNVICLSGHITAQNKNCLHAHPFYYLMILRLAADAEREGGSLNKHFFIKHSSTVIYQMYKSECISVDFFIVF